jgi:hypothetical protein
MVSLVGLRHGRLLALFSLHHPALVLAASGPSLGPCSTPVSAVTPTSASSAISGPQSSNRSPLPGSRSTSPPAASRVSTVESAPPLPPLTISLPALGKKRRPPLCLLLLAPGILPRPAGLLPWPVHPPVTTFPPLLLPPLPSLPLVAQPPPHSSFRHRAIKVKFPLRVTLEAAPALMARARSPTLRLRPPLVRPPPRALPSLPSSPPRKETVLLLLVAEPPGCRLPGSAVLPPLSSLRAL